MSDPEQQLTNHALLVLWGQFAQYIGLIDRLEAIPMGQKTRDHRPQTKLIEFFVSCLAGLPHLKDISRAAHPLDQDQAAAHAWRQPAWADYSGVSRTLSRMSLAEAEEVVAALAAISQPFIDREVNQAILEQGHLIWDGDLTGRPVSSTSTTYPNVAFGHMSDGVQLGYQATMVSMHSPTYGRLWLSTAPHPGDTVSCTQAKALVLAAEQAAGVRPRRRTDLLAGRIIRLEDSLAAAVLQLEQAQQQLANTRQQMLATVQQRVHCQQVVNQLAEDYQTRERPERPYSQLAKARRRLDVQVRRLPRRMDTVQQAQRRVSRRQEKVTGLQQEVEELRQRLRQFEQENAANPAPVAILLRLDGGFGTADNLALLVEMGYELYTKPYSHMVTAHFEGLVDDSQTWQQVGDNAEMVAWSNQFVASCPYPFDVGLERFHTGQTVQHSVLLHFGPTPVTADLPAWFQTYNARQTVEAGIKEGKGIFRMSHFKVRSEAGLLLQEHFAAFAANFVRWAAHWLSTHCSSDCADRQPTFSGVKEMVQVAAHTSAWVTWHSHGCLLRFTNGSIYAGRSFQTGDWVFQLPLPLFKNDLLVPP
jgi:hypothetical protein